MKILRRKRAQFAMSVLVAGTVAMSVSTRGLAADDIPKDGLVVWLDAADAATIEKDAAGKVSVWKDKSGSGHDAKQEKLEFRPTLAADAMNGKPALQFSKPDKTRMDLPDLSTEKMTWTAVAVVSNPEGGGDRYARIFAASDGQGYDYEVGFALSLPLVETGGPRLIASSFKDRWAKSVRVGCFSPAYHTHLHGYVSEIIVYNRMMTAEEQKKVKDYLTAKWGLQ